MPRVLHLIDAASPQACPATLAQLALAARSGPDTDYDVLLLGGAQLAADAHAAGIPRFERVGVPGGRALMGGAAAARALRGWRFDLVHCWSVGAAMLASLLFPAAPCLLSLVQMPSGLSCHWLRRATGRRGLRVTALDTALHDWLVHRGVPRQAVMVLEPGIDAELAGQGDRAAIRASWGLAGVQDRVIALLSDPPAAADARQACLTLGLVHESLTGRKEGRLPLRLVMLPEQSRRVAAWRMMLNYGVGELTMQDSRLRAPWQILAGCDVALAIGPHGNGLALRTALAAGVPVVAEAAPGIDGLIVNEVTGLLAEPGQPKRLAHRLHQMLAGPRQAADLAAAGQAAARARFAPEMFAQALRGLYQAVLAGPAQHAAAEPPASSAAPAASR